MDPFHRSRERARFSVVRIVRFIYRLIDLKTRRKRPNQHTLLAYSAVGRSNASGRARRICNSHATHIIIAERERERLWVLLRTNLSHMLTQLKMIKYLCTLIFSSYVSFTISQLVRLFVFFLFDIWTQYCWCCVCWSEKKEREEKKFPANFPFGSIRWSFFLWFKFFICGDDKKTTYNAIKQPSQVTFPSLLVLSVFSKLYVSHTNIHLSVRETWHSQRRRRSRERERRERRSTKKTIYDIFSLRHSTRSENKFCVSC